MSAVKTKYRFSTEVHFFNIMNVSISDEEFGQIGHSDDEELYLEYNVVPISQTCNRLYRSSSYKSINHSDFSSINRSSNSATTCNDSMVSKRTRQNTKASSKKNDKQC